MYLCLCRGVSEKDFKREIIPGKTLGQVCKKLGVARDCGSCDLSARQLFDQEKGKEHIQHSQSGELCSKNSSD